MALRPGTAFSGCYDQHGPDSERVYALHTPSVNIDPSVIEWHESYIGQAGSKTPPHLIETLQLDKDHSLTVLEIRLFRSRFNSRPDMRQ